MYGILLVIPFLFIRFSLLSYVNKDALPKAARFAPMIGKERIAYYIYQLSNSIIIVYMLFLPIRINSLWLFSLGFVVYSIGLVICIFSIIAFAKPSTNGLNTNEIYHFSRNPMYISYFVIFVGWSLLMQSFLLFIMVLIFQISGHWVILAEERWCKEQFGDDYKQYIKQVKRYI